MARGIRFDVSVSATRDSKPSFSSIVITGSSPPYGVRFLPLKSYGVEALILLASGALRSTPCFPPVFPLFSFLSVTIWVTLPGSIAEAPIFADILFYPSVFGGHQMVPFSTNPTRPLSVCIAQVPGRIGHDRLACCPSWMLNRNVPHQESWRVDGRRVPEQSAWPDSR